MKVISLIVPVLLLSALAAPVSAIGIAVGPYGGWNFTIAQDDAGSGALYGARAKLSAAPILAIEPWFTMITEGDVDHDDGGIEFTQKGGSIQSFGVNGSLGGYRTAPGIGFYATGGIGVYMLKPEQDYKDHTSRFGLNFGGGLVAKLMPALDLDVSARLIAITLEGGGSRKSVGLHAGLNYYFGL